MGGRKRFWKKGSVCKGPEVAERLARPRELKESQCAWSLVGAEVQEYSSVLEREAGIR